MCDLAKIFFTSKFSYVLFCNPTNKTETGTANRWGTTTNKPPGPIIMMGQSEEIYYTLFCRCTALLNLLPATATCAILLSQSTQKPQYVGFSSSIFTVEDPILSTAGDALSDVLIVMFFVTCVTLLLYY